MRVNSITSNNATAYSKVFIPHELSELIAKVTVAITDIKHAAMESQNNSNWSTERNRPGMIAWFKYSIQDIDLVLRIFVSLKHIEHIFKTQSNNNSLSLVQLADKSYECIVPNISHAISNVESYANSEMQEELRKVAQMDICSELEWYKIIQLVYPDAKTFFDVGMYLLIRIV